MDWSVLSWLAFFLVFWGGGVGYEVRTDAPITIPNFLLL